MGASDRSVPPGIRSEGYAVTNRAIACGMPFYVHSYGHSVCDSRYYVRRTCLAEHLMLYTVARCRPDPYGGGGVSAAAGASFGI